jgi:hypothetical protein
VRGLLRALKKRPLAQPVAAHSERTPPARNLT